MEIKQITSQHRRDFWATMECEHCGNEEKNVSGYDDANFHQNVIPNMKCKKCGKKAGDDYNPRSPKYGEHEVV